MTIDEYIESCRILDEMADATAKSKRKAYAGDGDPLRNFRKQAAFEGKSEYQIIQTFMNKQLTSINNAIESDPFKPIDHSEGMQSRLVDVINYCRILHSKLMEDKLV